MSNNVFFTIGSSIGKAGAYVVEGTRLGSTQIAAGARAGYASKSEELRARRQALGLKAAPLKAKVEVVDAAPTRRRTARA